MIEYHRHLISNNDHKGIDEKAILNFKYEGNEKMLQMSYKSLRIKQAFLKRDSVESELNGFIELVNKLFGASSFKYKNNISNDTYKMVGGRANHRKLYEGIIEEFKLTEEIENQIDRKDSFYRFGFIVRVAQTL